MEKIKDRIEYYSIVSDILNNSHFQQLAKIAHHHTNRLEHSKSVSLRAYKLTKKLHLDYASAARGGLLHDFFTETYPSQKKVTLIKEHPLLALSNSEKYFTLNNKEKNIITSHMYPLNFKYKPQYLESYIVCFIDKISYIYEVSKYYFSFKIKD